MIGVPTLCSVLRSKRVAQMNILVVRTFAGMRRVNISRLLVSEFGYKVPERICKPFVFYLG